MKKYIYSILLILITNSAYSQLAVSDTVLLAFKNDQFWSSSSELQPDAYKDFGNYGAVNLSDSDPLTCWAEGADTDGSGEFVLTVIPEKIEKLRIRNGYQKNEKIFNANNRAKTIEFTLYASFELGGYVTETHTGFCISEPLFTSTTILEDQPGYQDVYTSINWPEVYQKLSNDKKFSKDRFILKIKILDIYKGTKWNDACISDIHVIPTPYFNLTEDEQGFVKVYELKTDTLFYNPESIFQILEISKDAQWIIFIEMPADIENSRVESNYKLFNTNQEKFIELDDMFQMYGFTEEDGKIFLEGTDKDFNDIKIPLK